MPSYVYRLLLGCSERREPCRALTRGGDVREAVSGEACFIFKFVSLPQGHVKSQSRVLISIVKWTHPSRLEVSI